MHTILCRMMYAAGQGKPQRMHFRAHGPRAPTGSNRERGEKTAITIIKRNCQEKNTENKQVRKVTAEFTAGGGERSWR